jgi:cytoskeletal protein RodZ
VFVRGFVRAYARAVGGDEAQAMRLLEQRLAERNAALAADEPGRVHVAGRRRLMLAALVAIVLALSGLGVFALLHRH